MTVPLSRNRDYRLLWISQALSASGFSASMIAFPLLVLALTGSPATTGLVLGVEAAAQVVVGLPGGALVDRWNRKKIMLMAEATQALAVASLVLALWLDMLGVAHIVVVAALMGVCNGLFGPAEQAALVKIVPQEQLATALAMNSARGAVGQLSGTALGGFLFAVGRLVPFAFNVLTHTISFVALLFVRVPPSEVEQAPDSHLGKEMAEGLRWVWRQRHVRVTVLCAVSLNFLFSAYYIVIIVLVSGRGVSSGEIGVMAAMLGVGGICGALLAPYLHRAMSPYASIIVVFWALAVLTPVAVFIDNGLLMGALFFAMALLPPTANTTINTYQLLLTPDRLRGRLSGVMGMISGVSAAAGPAFGGLLVQAVAGTYAVLLIAAAIAVIALITTLSPTMRSFPREETLAMDASDSETTKGR
ncbi:MFS transporter [Lentzea sp. HUAS TT2]|uniref:MFS transporter n=1 Tax=Lentzea sp. HUAS TT2 TaxID=3447454 RepID=UPI003F72DDBC